MKCIYHYDIDGRTAAAIVAKYTNNYNKNDYIEMVSYNDRIPYERIEPNELVYIVDFSFKLNTVHILKSIYKITKNIIWIDHHKSSLDIINEYPEFKPAAFEIGKSGALLTYMYLYKCTEDEVPMFIKLISDYDCWIYKYGDMSLYFEKGLQTTDNGPIDKIWKELFNPETSEQIMKDYIHRGSIICKYMTCDDKFYREKYGFETRIDGIDCYMVNKKTNSIIFGDLIKKYPIVSTFIYNGKCVTYSLYTSRDDIDCAKIASKYGGGGHAKAAGFSSDKILFKEMKLNG